MATGSRALLLAGALTIVAAACSNSSTSSTSTAGTPAQRTITISNQGGISEGHTPTAFPGTGTGLFVGDNLNTAFPDGVGVQTYLDFALPPDLDESSAVLRSDQLKISGTPFDDLGDLVVERVVYTTFGPELFDLQAAGPSTACQVLGGTAVECDVGSAVNDATSAGSETIQFRLRFEIPGDNDQNQDLAMFHRSDSNQNEQGLFTLVIEAAG